MCVPAGKILDGFVILWEMFRDLKRFIGGEILEVETAEGRLPEPRTSERSEVKKRWLESGAKDGQKCEIDVQGTKRKLLEK